MGNELSKIMHNMIKETTNAIITTKTGTKTIPYKNSTELNSLKTDNNITSIETTGGQKIKEMSRRPRGYQLIDPNFDATPYIGKKVSRVPLVDIINYIRENPGVEKLEIKNHFGFVRFQIVNAIINGLKDAGIVAKSNEIEVDDETGEVTITPEEPSPDSPVEVEDYFIGDKLKTRGLGVPGDEGSVPPFVKNKNIEDIEDVEDIDGIETDKDINNVDNIETSDDTEDVDTVNIPDTPEEQPTKKGRMSDTDYKAWMDYMKYTERAAKVKAALTQVRKQNKRGDDLNVKNNEADKLLAKKLEYEDKIKNIISSNEYVRNRVKNELSEQAINEEIIKRFKKLANI